jgi:hypothetical protein
MGQTRVSSRTLPDGSPAWFVRTAAPGQYQLTPCSRQGWIVMAGWAAASLRPVPLALTRRTSGLIGFTVVEFCLAALLVVVALRTSAPLPPKEMRP